MKAGRPPNALFSSGREFTLTLDGIKSTIFPEATKIRPGVHKPFISMI